MDQAIDIKINNNSRVPKYKQIVDSIIDKISKGILEMGEKISSINYNSFVDSLGANAHVDLKVYHCDEYVF